MKQWFNILHTVSHTKRILMLQLQTILFEFITHLGQDYPISILVLMVLMVRLFTLLALVATAI